MRATYHQVILIDRDCEHDFSDAWTDASFVERLAAFPGGALLSTMTETATGMWCTLGSSRSARDADYRRQLRAAFERDLVREVPYENPGLEQALPTFRALELRRRDERAGALFASTGGWDAAEGVTCEFLMTLRAEEDVVAELLAALSYYQADPQIDVYDGRLIQLGRPVVPDSPLDHLLLTTRRPGESEPLEPLHPLDRHVDLLWAIPLAAAEAAVVSQQGVEPALAMLAAADVDHPHRQPART